MSEVLAAMWIELCERDRAAGIQTPSLLEIAFEANKQVYEERAALVASWTPDSQWQWKKHAGGPWLNLKRGVRPNFWPEQEYRIAPATQEGGAS